MALVTTADLKNYMNGVSLSAKQLSVAQTVLDGVQQELELYLSRPLQPVQVREKRRTNRQGDLVLSVTPVYEVLSMRRADSTDFNDLPEGDITPLSPEEVDRIWDAMPMSANIVPGGVHVGSVGVWYVIEYIGGYNGYTDEALKRSILEVASRIMTVNHDDTLSIKDDIAREPAATGTLVKGWKDEELKRYDRLRRRIAL